MNYIIKSADELKDPFLCFCIFKKFEEVAGEDFLDYNENIINGTPFLFWMYGKDYITNENIIEILEEDSRPSIMDILRSEILFPETYGESAISITKTYSILAECMSLLPIFRQRLYDSVNDKASAFEGNMFYKDENGISLACIIDEEDMVFDKMYSKEIVASFKAFEWYYLPLREQYEFVKTITIAESDKF